MTDFRRRLTSTPAGGDDTAFVGAVASLLEPIAMLAVSRGVSLASVADLLKAAFVEAARRAQPESAGQRVVSRVATATGLTRREVTRLLGASGRPASTRPSPATQVFTRWRADQKLKDRRGNSVALPRQGPAPSFESLARSVTQDVHPRSLLDELVRLGLAAEQGELVKLTRESVVPAGDRDKGYAFLGNNVGDHLRASVANVLAETPRHVEQAVFADGLSETSMAAFREIAKAQWEALLQAVVPALQALVDADAAAGRVADRRVRIGLYAYHESMNNPAMAPVPATNQSSTARKRGSPSRKKA